MTNQFNLIGNIARDIELRTTAKDIKIVDLTLAVRNGKDDTSFITVTIFNNMAETVNQYCSKGDLIGVNGTIKNHNWEDKDGKKHYDYQLIVNKISFLKKAKSKEETKIPQNTVSEYDTIKSDVQLTDDDLPF